ncbi:hypothetical protein [Actomonas aquatica]|uniref:DUF4276 domain-containing protein n=1 Tax=Actomonas aquatica TaxID=2866162 RepID=A0ABZ1C7S4_9BACT|nr:hypothetical protein [Opitutus sp. WL0086]WRQ87763.1 hypothetical protein K1X11_023370 [Opitutus sp. WL0086]
MKVALLSESPADEAAIAVLVETVLGQRIQRVRPALRARGWPNVRQVLPAVVRHLHFRTDAELLVVVADADDSVVHTSEHDHHPGCRVCQLRAVFRKATKNLPPARGRDRVLRGVGIAVPAMEGWYLCGSDETVTEEAWIAGQETARQPFSRAELKERVYGTSRPTLALETEKAVAAVRRMGGDLRRLEHEFPGFAVLANDLRAALAEVRGRENRP